MIRKTVDHEFGSTILGPGSLVVPRGDGPFFSVTNGVQPIGADAQADKEILTDSARRSPKAIL
jgi:hypothetical protein